MIIDTRKTSAAQQYSGQVKLATGLEIFHTFDNLKCFH